MVGVLADDGLQLPAAEQLVLAFAQVQRDVGAAAGLLDHLDGEVALAAGFPAHAWFGLDAGAARNHGHLVGDDERGIEADAELADQVRILGLVAGQRREEFPRAGLGDGAEVFDGFVAAHADAIVGDGDGARRLVEGDADLQIGIVSEQRGVVERLEAQLVAGIGRIGDQLAQENFLVAVQGVNHQVQQLFDFGLETQGFAFCAAVADSDMHETPIQNKRCDGRWGHPDTIQEASASCRHGTRQPSPCSNPRRRGAEFSRARPTRNRTRRRAPLPSPRTPPPWPAPPPCRPAQPGPANNPQVNETVTRLEGRNLHRHHDDLARPQFTFHERQRSDGQRVTAGQQCAKLHRHIDLDRRHEVAIGRIDRPCRPERPGQSAGNPGRQPGGDPRIGKQPLRRQRIAIKQRMPRPAEEAAVVRGQAFRSKLPVILDAADFGNAEIDRPGQHAAGDLTPARHVHRDADLGMTREQARDRRITGRDARIRAERELQ